jgi:O-succinylbenzoic acid--CoA ligase
MGYNINYMSAFEKLTLNGHTYNRDELVHITEQKMKHADSDEEEFYVHSFIHQWVSPTETIEVRTSGSTGVPKLKIFRKEQFIESAKMTCDYFNLGEGMNMLLCLSANYIAGKMMIVRAFVSGANLITVAPKGNPLEDLEDKIDFTAMVPLQAQNAILEPETNRIFSSIRSVIIGGASVSHNLQQLLTPYPNNIYATFAMTETLSHIALKRLSGKGKKDLYELMPGIKITEDERGCMIVDAPHLSEELINTNDIIVMTDENHFRWLGRYDNVINSDGVKVYPEAIEEKLASLFPDNRFYITSIPDENLGQKVVMVIENTARVNLDSLKSRIEKLLDRFEAPKEYLFVSEFTETPNGKVQRQETLKLALK